jgi:hypothetical protein
MNDAYTVAALAKAKAARNLYAAAYKKYGALLLSMRGDAPIGLLVGHVLRVNPELSDTPAVRKDARRGFAKASYAESRTVNIPVSQLDEPPTCAYVHGREINRAASNLYTTHPTFFTTADRNFWKCSYLAHTLGTSVFENLCSAACPALPSQSAPVATRDRAGNIVSWEVPPLASNSAIDDLYSEIIYHVNTSTVVPAGYTPTAYKKLVLLDCEYVCKVWELYGNGNSNGFGRLPVLSGSQAQAILNRAS